MPSTAAPVVAAVPLSGRAAHLVHYARYFDGPLHVLHVVPSGTTPETMHRHRAALARTLEAWAGDPAPLVVLRVGDDVAEAIAAYAAEEGAALVVVGQPERPRWRLGTTSGDVVRTAACPVVVVPEGAHAPQHVLVGVDLGSEHTRWLQAAQAFRAHHLPTARLTAVYVIPPLPYPHAWVGDVSFALMPDFKGQAVRELQHAVTEALGPDASVAVDVEAGPVAQNLLRAAAAHGADLVAVAPHHHPLVDRILLGSVAERVVQLADRPVLVLRAPEA